jgi:hypothetical protein
MAGSMHALCSSAKLREGKALTVRVSLSPVINLERISIGS